VPHDVFISYSHEDKLTADAVCARLEAKGIRCWIAPRDVMPGVEYGESILDGISESQILVLIYSGNSNQSTHVHREIERAVSKEITILPFRIENVPLSKSLEYFISAPHWLDALTTPVELHIDHLVATVAILLARKGIGPEREAEVAEPVAATGDETVTEAAPGPAVDTAQPQGLIDQASDAMEQGRYDEAERLASEVLALEPTHPTARALQAAARRMIQLDTDLRQAREAAPVPVVPGAVPAPLVSTVSATPRSTGAVQTSGSPSWLQTHVGVVFGAITGVVLVGGAVIALFVALSGQRSGATPPPTPSPSSLLVASALCANPNESGCPLQLGVPVHGVLASTSEKQQWYVDVPAGTDFWIALTNLPVDYDLTVRGPNGFSSSSSNSSVEDEVVQINRAAGGRYQAEISAWLDVSPAPYTLAVTRGVVASTPVPATPTSSLFGGSSPFSSSDGCSSMGAPRRMLTLGQAGSDSLSSSERAETWLLSVPRGGSTLHVELGNLSTDYDLYVRGPNSSCTSSTNSGTTIDVVDVRNAPAGIYFILVSAVGDTSPRPYGLIATLR
jgi:hypothetical protein